MRSCKWARRYLRGAPLLHESGSASVHSRLKALHVFNRTLHGLNNKDTTKNFTYKVQWEYCWILIIYESVFPLSAQKRNTKTKTLVTTTDAKTGCTEHRSLNFTTVFRRRIFKLRKQTNWMKNSSFSLSPLVAWFLTRLPSVIDRILRKNGSSKGFPAPVWPCDCPAHQQSSATSWTPLPPEGTSPGAAPVFSILKEGKTVNILSTFHFLHSKKAKVMQCYRIFQDEVKDRDIHTCSSTVQSWLKVSDLFGWQILPLIICKDNTSISNVKQCDHDANTMAAATFRRSKPWSEFVSVYNKIMPPFRKQKKKDAILHSATEKNSNVRTDTQTKSCGEQRWLSGKGLLTAQRTSNVVWSDANNKG